jgi:hypothetical protein
MGIEGVVLVMLEKFNNIHIQAEKISLHRTLHRARCFQSSTDALDIRCKKMPYDNFIIIKI